MDKWWESECKNCINAITDEVNMSNRECKVCDDYSNFDPKRLYIHLCETCKYNYPECPTKKNDVQFGQGKGNDNIIECKYHIKV